MFERIRGKSAQLSFSHSAVTLQSSAGSRTRMCRYLIARKQSSRRKPANSFQTCEEGGSFNGVARQELARLVGEEKGIFPRELNHDRAISAPKVDREFQRSNPKIRLSLLGANTEKIVAGVLDGTLAIGLIEGPSLHRDLGEESFVADEIVVVVPSKHEWSVTRSRCNNSAKLHSSSEKKAQERGGCRSGS